jgi:hypothetical protein
MRTDDLIQNFVKHLSPVRPLRPPAVRAAVWLALSLAYAAIIVLAYGLTGGRARLLGDDGYIVEQAATLATAGLAALAAFSCVIPGRGDRAALVPLVAFAVWFVGAWMDAQPAGPISVDRASQAFSGWACLPLSLLLGLIPAVAIIPMLRRGAPLRPRLTMALGMLAAIGFGNLGLRFFNIGDVARATVLWHAGGAALLLGLAVLSGPAVLRRTGAPTDRTVA